MEKTQFETVMQAIAGLNGKLEASTVSLNEKIDSVAAGLRTELRSDIRQLEAKMGSGFAAVASGFAAVDVRFDRLEKKVDGIFEQVGETHEHVTDLKTRVSALESPSA